MKQTNKIISPALKKYIKDICKIYGVKIVFTKGIGGSYRQGVIWVDMDLEDKKIIDLFCHELAHYKNDIEGKYPEYHREDSNIVIKRIGLKKYSEYALEAEVYTEKEGKKISKTWFPRHRYRITYKKNSYYLGLMYGYYFGGLNEANQ